MIYIFLFLLNVNQFKYTSCMDNDYLLLKKENNIEIVSKKTKNYDFKNKDDYHILDFYCYNDKLYLLNIEKKEIDSVLVYKLIVLYKIDENDMLELDWIPTPNEYYYVDDCTKRFHFLDNELFFYNYQNYQIYSYNYYKQFSPKQLFRDYEEGLVRELIYSNGKIAIDFKKINASSNHIYILKKDTEEIINDKVLRDFYSKNNSNVLAYTDGVDKLYINLNSNEIATDLEIDAETRIKIFFVDNVIYFFTKLDSFYLFAFFNDGSFIKKEINNDIFDFYYSKGKIIYLKNSKELEKIELAKDEVIKPEIIDTKTKDKLEIKISNFNMDSIYFDFIELEISKDKDFSNIILNKKIKDYSKNNKEQLVLIDSNNLDKDKKFFLRLRYVDIFKRKSSWIFSDFIILSVKDYPKTEILNPKNEQIIEKFPFFVSWDYDAKFTYNVVIAKDEFFNGIVKEYYYLQKDKEEIKHLPAGEYFLKIYYKDEFERKSKENIIKFYIKDKSSTSGGCSFQ